MEPLQPLSQSARDRHFPNTRMWVSEPQLTRNDLPLSVRHVMESFNQSNQEAVRCRMLHYWVPMGTTLHLRHKPVQDKLMFSLSRKATQINTCMCASVCTPRSHTKMQYNNTGCVRSCPRASASVHSDRSAPSRGQTQALSLSHLHRKALSFPKVWKNALSLVAQRNLLKRKQPFAARRK